MRGGAACLLVLSLAAPAWAGRNAFLDSAGVLKTHGFVEENAPGDVKIPVADDFALAPGRWRRVGEGWEPVTPPPRAEEPSLVALRVHVNAVLSNPLIPQGVKDVLNAIKDRLR